MMKLLGKVVLIVALLASLASISHAVFGDGSLNVLNHEKGRTISKRSVLRLFNLVSMFSHQLRSSPNENSTTVNLMARTPGSSSGLKTDITSFLNLNREKRAVFARHGEIRNRRSFEEFQGLEDLLKTTQDELTNALRNFNGALFSHRQPEHRPTHSGHPLAVGLSNILMPFNLLPAENTILFLHRDHQKGSNSSIESRRGENATSVSPNSTSANNPTGIIVGSAEPATSVAASPVVVVGQTANDSSSTSAKPDTITENTLQGDRTIEAVTSSLTSVEPRDTTTVAPTEQEKSIVSEGAQTSQTTRSSNERRTDKESTTVRSPTAV